MFSAEQEGFVGYQETTIDPGPALLIATVIFCALSLAVLPCLISLRRRCNRSRADTAGSRSTDESPTEEKEGKGMSSLAAENKRSEIPDNESVSSKASDTSSVALSLMNAILDGNPRSGPNARRARKQVEKRNLEMEQHRNDNVFRLYDRKRNESNDNEDTDIQFDNQSLGTSCSALSKLDHDEVSIRDAVDAQDGYDHALAQNSPQQQEDLPFWSPACWKRWFNSLLEIAEWDFEMKRICKLATPFVLKALAEGVLEAVNVALIGRLISTSAVAAYVTVDMLVELSASLFVGFNESLATVGSQALGASNKRLVGQYVQIAVVGFIVCFVPLIIFWMIFMEDTLRWFGFGEETVTAGTEFSRIYLYVQLVSGVSDSVFALLDIIDKEKYSSLVTIATHVLETVGVVLVAVSQDPSLEKVGLAFLFVTAGSLFLNVLFIMWKGWFDPYLGGIIGSFAFANGKALRLMLKNSASLSLGYLLSYSEWEFLALIAQTLGPAEVTAWGLLGTLWDIVELVTESVADAAEVRCAMLLGSARPQKAKLSAYKSIYLGSFIAMFLSAVVFIVGDNLPMWMTTDATLQRMVAELIPLFGIGNIALTVGTLAWTLVGSQGRYRLSTAVGFFGSWFVTMPLAIICSIALKLDLRGQTAAVVIGYMVSGTINSYFLFTTNWEKQSREVIEAAAEAEDDDESSSSSSSSSSSN